LQGICVGFRKSTGYLRSGKTYFVFAGAAYMGAANGISPFCAIAGIASNKQPPVIADRADDEGRHKG